MFTIKIALLLLTRFQITLGQFWGIGGGAWGYECGGHVQNVGSECYEPNPGKGVAVCVGKITAIFVKLPNHPTLKLIIPFSILF